MPVPVRVTLDVCVCVCVMLAVRDGVTVDDALWLAEGDGEREDVELGLCVRVPVDECVAVAEAVLL